MSKAPNRFTSLAFGIFSVSLGVFAFAFGHQLIQGNDNARDVIVTVFSILAGFLIAVMTLMGDQSVLPGSWRMAAGQRDKIRAKLIRQKWLFHCYLVTLSLIFVRTLLADHCPSLGVWIERAYFGFAVTSFSLSFKLPSTLMQVQSDRIDAVIAARQSSSSTLDKN